VEDIIQRENLKPSGIYAPHGLAVFAECAALEQSSAHSQPLISGLADIVPLLASECSDPDIGSKLKAPGLHFDDNNAASMLDPLGVRHFYSSCRLP